MVALMLVLNYFLTPLYMGVSQADVAALILPVLLPFNLIKAGANGVLIAALYAPFMAIWRKTGISSNSTETSHLES